MFQYKRLAIGRKAQVNSNAYTIVHINVHARQEISEASLYKAMTSTTSHQLA